jgi:glycoside/pentoside/hexuronide:cation symporter, GPH family
MPRERLPATVLFAYALPGLPLAALTLPLYIYLPAFYADDLGLGLTAVGGILLFARLADVAFDPFAGVLSDRFRSRYGRRKPFLLLATPLALAALHQLFIPPAGAGAGHLLGWTLLLYAGYTLMTLPYWAWGAELSPDYDERSRIVGAREAAVVLGTVVAAAMPAVVAGGRGGALEAIAWLVILCLPVAVALALWGAPEPRVALGRRLAFSRAARLIWRNGPFRRLLLAYLLNSAANGLTATLFLLFVEHALGIPERSGALLLVYFLCGVASVPLWVWLSARFGKHRSWAAGMALCALFFLAVPFLGPGDFLPFLAVCVATGLCLGADLALPASMQADVVDLDRARGGGERAGLFFALWAMATKLALALAVGVAFPLLDLMGFDPASGRGTWALAALYAAAPIAVKLCAILPIWRFPIDAERQARLRAAITRREARRTAA